MKKVIKYCKASFFTALGFMVAVLFAPFVACAFIGIATYEVWGQTTYEIDLE